MKNRYLNSLAIIAIALFSFGCDGTNPTPDADPTALELQLEALMNNNNSWGLTSGTVTKDGFDVTNQFDGFELNIKEFTYTTQNSLDTAWPGSGNWEFVGENPNKIERSDGVEITVNITGSNLSLSYTVTNVGGKGNGIDGNYVFTLTSN